jgi:hypothetical protein
MKLLSIRLREIQLGDIAAPLDLNTAKNGFHRTSEWKFVVYYDVDVYEHGRVRIESTPDNPIYAAEGYIGRENDGKQKYCLIRPLHKKNQFFCIYLDKEVDGSIRRRLKVLSSHGISLDELSGICTLFRFYGEKEILDLYSEWLEERKSLETELYEQFSDFVKQHTRQFPPETYDLKRLSIDFQEQYNQASDCPEYLEDRNLESLRRKWYRENLDEIKKAVKEGGEA